jgi:AP2-associated kinase
MCERCSPIALAHAHQIYSERTHSEARRNQQLPAEPDVASSPLIGIQKVAPVKQVQHIPDITPMRRGRPTAPVQQPPAAKPSSSPMRGTASDPFAALDSQDVQVRRAAADELASRFPSLDEFSLLHDRGQKFEFGQTPTTPDPAVSSRVVQALADDAFALPPSAKVDSMPSGAKPLSNVPSTSVSRSASLKKPKPYEAKDSPRSSNPTIVHPIPQHVGMVSTGVQTSPRSSPTPQQQKLPDVNSRPIWKVPLSAHHTRTLSSPRTFENPELSPALKPEFALPARPSLDSRSRSHLSSLGIPKSPASSRPSLESQRPSAMDLGSTLDRSKSANSSGRPASMYVESNLDYLRDREKAPGRSFDAPSLQRRTTSSAIDDSPVDPEEKNVRSSIDFLRAIEREEHPDHKHKHRRSSSQSKHAKRGSLSSLTSNTKNIVKGRFGDAFRRFEQNKTPEHERDQPPLTPTDQLIDPKRGNNTLTPIAGSEATGGLSDDDRSAIDETQDLPPEVRRELERRRLSEEERRVEAAAAEYRLRLAQQGSGKPRVPSKASTIQNRVKNLLDESSKPAAASKTAEGYGKYTDTGKPLPMRPEDQSGMRQPPTVARKPVNMPSQQDLTYAKPASVRPNMPPPIPSSSAPPAINLRTPSGPAPRLPPKPKALQTGGSATSPTKTRPATREKPLTQQVGGNDAVGDDFDVDTFSKRYPSLSGLEMVETEIPKRGFRDV